MSIFQIHVRFPDAGQSRWLYSRYDFELGEWFHIGWSYYNEVSTDYKDGCLHEKTSEWSDDVFASPINAGILFGSHDDIDIDMQLDEVYFWDVRKPAVVFSALYANGF